METSQNVLITPCNNDEHFNKRFLTEGVWFDVKIAKSKVEVIEYVGIYRSEQSSPSQSLGVITHLGKVRKDGYGVVPYGNTNGYLFNFEELMPIEPLWRTPETKYGFQQFTYCSLADVLESKSLTELEKAWAR